MGEVGKITPELYVLHIHICGNAAVHSEREGISRYCQHQCVPLIVCQKYIPEGDLGLPAIGELSAPEEEVEFIPRIAKSKQQSVTVFLQKGKDVFISLKDTIKSVSLKSIFISLFLLNQMITIAFWVWYLWRFADLIQKKVFTTYILQNGEIFWWLIIPVSFPL